MSNRQSPTAVSHTAEAATRRDARRTASFHDAAARMLYGERFAAIAIPAVAAGVAQARSRCAAPAARDLPAILRNGWDD